MHPTAAPFVPPPAYRVMWDWEIEGFKKVTRPNLPCVFRCGEISDHKNGHYVKLTEEWQFFWFDLCAKVVFGRCHQDLTPDEYKWLANRWISVGATTTAFTNQHGLDEFRNYVTGEHMDTEEPKIYTLVCGGASLAGSLVRYEKGKKSAWMLKVARFDGTRPPPPVETIDPSTDPRVFFATTIRSQKVKGKYQIPVFDEKSKSKPPDCVTKEFDEGYQVNPFPQFKIDEKLFDCPVPIVANSDIYYPLKWLVPIEGGVKARPYFP